MDTIVCNKCGNIVNGNVKFCNECGAAIAAPAAPRSNQYGSAVCPNCKSAVNPGRSYCSNCGTILYSNTSQQNFFNETKPVGSTDRSKDEITDFIAPAAPSQSSSGTSRINQPVSAASSYYGRSSVNAAPSQPQQPVRPAAQPQPVRPTAPAQPVRPTAPTQSAPTVPTFSLDGKLPTAAYSEKVANEAAVMNSYGTKNTGYSDIASYSAPKTSQPYSPVEQPAATAQPKQQYSAQSFARQENPQPAYSSAANAQPSQPLPIDYTQVIKLDNKKTENAPDNQPQPSKNMYIDEYDEEFDEEPRPDKESKYQPISAWGFVGIMLLAGIPIIGWIFVIVWACGGCRKVNKRSWARAAIIMTLINILFTCLIVYALVSLFGEAMNQLWFALSSVAEILKLFL